MKKLDILLLSFLSLVLIATSFAQKDSTHFVTTWQTDSTGISNDSAIFLEVDSNYSYNFDIDWDNDGVFDTLNVTSSILIQYSSPGNYTIRIRGVFPSTYFEPSPLFPTAGIHDQKKLLSIDQWGTYAWKNLAGAFKGCSNVTSNAIDAPNLTNVTGLSEMFSGASSFNADLNNWDVSSIIYMSSMFQTAISFNGNVSNWDVSNVKSTRNMFADAFNFNQDVSGWDVSSVYNMDLMFANNVNFNQDISGWKVDSVGRMKAMFIFASQFDQDLSSWNISKVVDMVSLFDLSGLSRTNYDLILNAWQAKPHRLNVTLGTNGLKYCLGDSARLLLIADGWSFSGDSLDCRAVGLEEVEQVSQIRFYPNPATNQITIESEVPIEQVNIYSVLGTIVKSSTETTLFIEDLPDGNYIIEMITRYGSKKDFLVKQ
ncbi:MAG: BspA family leucine-rich repeat surface protein [Flavobacteriales bacterium]|nr:BspA family leucine-rich repeat surface protein [Flavobacteriales bacterium]